MPALSSRLRPNDAEVAAKVMDGEAIMINLSNGMYYSMELVGGHVWEQIDAGRSLEEIVQSIVSTYDVSWDQAAADLDSLVTDLLAESLVFEQAGPTEASIPVPPASAGKQPYEPPLLNKFSDMGDLLALDPPMPGMQDIPWKEAAEEPAR